MDSNRFSGTFCGIPYEEVQRRFEVAIYSRYTSKEEFYKEAGLGQKYRMYIHRHLFYAEEHMKMCEFLHLDPFDCLPIESFRENRKENILENRFLGKYCDLNMIGRKKVMDYLEDIHATSKYRREY